MQQTPLPLHPAQHDVFTDQFINPQSPHYNLGGYIVLRGELDKPKFIETINSGAAVFDAFSMRFDADSGRFEGYYDDGYTVMEIDEVDFSHRTPEEVIAWMQDRFNTAFEIDKDKPLFEQYLIKIREDEHWYFGRYHHVITDGYGFIVWVNYVANKYTSLVEGSEVTFDYPSYREAAAAAFDYKNSPAYAAEANYWKEKLPEKPERLLQKKYADAIQPFVKSSTFQLDLHAEQRLLINNLQESAKVGIQQLTIAALVIYFGKTSGRSEFLFGIPVHKRGSRKLRNIVGMFSGILPHRSAYDPDIILLDLLKDITASQKRDYRNQNYLNGDLTRTLKIPATEGYLCEVLINYEPLLFELDFGTAINASIFRLATEADRNPLQICWRDYAVRQAMQLQIHYSTAFFTNQEIEWLSRRLLFILQQFSAGLHEPIGSFEILPPAERQLLHEFNNTAVDYPGDKTIVDLFEEQVRKTPENIALVFEDEQLSYTQLNKKANQLAHYLISKGVTKQTPVPICIERGVDMITGLLGILKAGGAYVPIDPQYPPDRIKYMLDDSGAALVVSSKRSTATLPFTKEFTSIEIDDNTGQIHTYPAENPASGASPDSLAYIMYTSGSTGEPKGVMATQHNVVSLVKGVDYVGFSDRDTLLSTGSPSFDATTFEYWGMLLNGGKLVLCSEYQLLDNELLKKQIRTQQVNKIWFTSSWFNQLVDGDISVFEGLETVVVGGEKLSGKHIEQLRQVYPFIALVNGYGPTENTTFSLTYAIRENKTGRSIPIGRPLANRSVYVLDGQRKMVPIGVTGEIYLGGAGLTRGYLNNGALTEEKFVIDPYGRGDGARMYKTGDMGCWLPDGNIQFQGRVDEQVKIRGYRIEPGEIEMVVCQQGSVKQCVVVAAEDHSGKKRLVGYVVAEGSFDREKVIAYLKTRLPEYMVPALWVQLETLPLTPNGKTDRKALPDVDASEQVNHGYLAPATRAEADLAAVWQELLNIERIGTAHNFFELGGDSIIAIQVTSRMKQLGYFLQPKDIFIHQTISNLSAVLKSESGTAAAAEQGLLTGVAGLLPIQQWYFEKEQPAISHYNQSILLQVEKSALPLVLQQAITVLTSHHDALRFMYHQTNGVWHQEYGSEKPEISNEDLRSVPGHLLHAAITERAGIHQQSLNIGKGEIFRAVWIQTPDTEKYNRFLIVIHHLAVDVVSWRILLEDLQRILNAMITGGNISLGNKSSSFRQWYAALENYGQSMRLLYQKKYWEEVVKNYTPVPVDKETAEEVRIKDTGLVTIKLDAAQTTNLLQVVPRVYHTEINDLLLCGLTKTLSSWNNSNKIIIGLEGHGREDIVEGIDTSHTVGWFTNLYPVLFTMPSGNSEDDLIKTVKEHLRQVPDKGMGYGVLKYINKEASLQGKDPWDIVFNYLGQTDNIADHSKWISGSFEAAGAMRSEEHSLSEKIAINCAISSGQLTVNWTYSTRHYNTGTIKKLAEDYILNLEALIAHCIQQQNTAGSVYTPSDYGFGAEINYAELDGFLHEPFKGKPRKEQVESVYKLSGLQQGMLFHSLYNEDSIAYIEQFVCDLTGADLQALKESWAMVIARHSVLRSAFYYDQFRIPVQCVYHQAALPVDILDYRNLSEEEQWQAIHAYQARDQAKRFDLQEAPLMRLALLQLSKGRCRMIWTSHHILFDGWSFPILINELLSNYGALISGKALHIQKQDRYEDYIRYIERSNKEQEERYWRNYMKGVTESTLLPFISTMAERTKGGASYRSISLQINAAKTTQIQSYVQKHRLTVNTVIQGVWSCLLHYYTGNTNVVYGVIVSGRPGDLPDVEQRVGLYINTLPLHAQLQKEQEILPWLQRLQDDQVASRQYQYTPLSTIQHWSGVQRDLFDTLLIFENYPVSKISSSEQWGLQVENVQIHEQTNYPLTLMIGSADKINISFTYNAKLLDEVYVQQICNHFEHALFQLIDHATARFEDINMLTPPEEQQLLHDFNNTAVHYPKNKTIVDLFEEQVAKTPENIAIVFEDEQLSYAQLNKEANRLAWYLISKGVTKETLVPICIERGFDMIIGLLAIVKAGAAYVPIDPGYPPDRIRYMLEDCAATLVITSEQSRAKLNGSASFEVIELGKDRSVINDCPHASPPVSVRPNQLAYVIYTSGSTGRPKGVMIEHSSLTNLLYSITDKVAFNADSSFLSVTTYSFDICYLEFYTPLVNGGKLILIPRDVAIDGFALSAALADHHPTHMQGTPATWQLLLDAGWDNKEHIQILTGGEAVKESLKNELTQLGNVFNLYGPTETTIWSAIKKLARTEKVLIGQPLANTEVYIVHPSFRLAAVGCIGEICISGAGIAKGYLNRPDLTAEKFVKNPFTKNGAGTMYKTGDIGRWLPDGNLEYLGRKDDQVKIRGYRIELGEIENVLQQSGLVKQAVVLAISDTNENKRLVAYIVPEAHFEKKEMLDYLSSRLPAYMIPSLLKELQTLPLTQNGKIDRMALAAIETEDILADQFVAARNETEEKLTEIWQRLLETDRVGIHDDFFESGGHSLLAVRMIAAIRKELGAEPGINDVFDYPTVALMAAKLQSLLQHGVQPVVSSIGIQTRPVHIPLSFSQERLWFIHQLEGSLQYHVPAVLGLHGKLNKEALHQSLQAIINRHEVLRTVIRQAEGKGYQHVLDKGGWQPEEIDGEIFEEDKQALQLYIDRIIKKPFDLSNDRLIRATLIALNDNDHMLVVTMHHIASDAWSTAILVKEFMELYSAYSENRTAQLPPMQLQYADYAIWQRKNLHEDILNKKLDYWKEKLDNVLPLQLPADYSRPAGSSTNGASATFHISPELHDQLLQVSRQHKATLYMTLLAAFNVLLYRYSGQHDVCVGTSIAGRQQQELEGLIGYFVNTLALRNHVKGDMQFVELLEAVRATMLEAYAHQDVPFEKVVEAVVKDRDPGRSPLFQVMLVLRNTPDVPDLILRNLVVSPEPYEFTTVKFDLTFFLTETPQGLEGNVLYSTDLFKRDRIERMMDHFIMLLHSVAATPGNHVGTLKMLTIKEENALKQGPSAGQVKPRENNTVVALFEKQAIRWPRSVAVSFEGTDLSYAELNERANRLAHYLRGCGVKEDTLVPLFIDRGPDMITGIIGILKAGGAYVPIDTGLPLGRINFILQDTAAPVVVTSRGSREKLAAFDIELVETDGTVLNDQSRQNPYTGAVAHNLVYVMYTSGSTGQPKGVMVTHGNLTDYVQGLDDRTGINSCQSFALVSTIATDLGNTVLFSSLISGGTLHIFSKEMVSNIEGLHNYFGKHYIDCVKIVPSHWKALMMDGAPLLPRRLLIFGGEALQPEQVAIIRESGRNCRVINHYGPTETTVGKLLYEIDIHQEYEGTIPIGKPFGDNRVYILSADLSLCPTGVPGQLYIGGAGVARGYLNNEKLTGEKFITDPFDETSALIFYKTGDQVKYDAEGDIIFLGRIDDQVKIRGYRVEPGEVERVLSACEMVKQAVVLAKEDSQGNKRLIGYIVPDGYFDSEGVREYLQQKLPDYMIPAVLVSLEAMPLTANGKADRQALPDPDTTVQPGNQYVAPRNEAEQQLASIWEEVLEVEQAGIHDNFFELGGHSLLAVRLISAIRKAFNVEVSIGAVFDYPTIAELAAQLSLPSDKEAETLPAITAVQPRPVQIPLSFSQERLWFIDQMEGSVQYHVPAVLRLKGKLEIQAFSDALQEIVNRHEILRTVIRDDNGRPYQHINGKGQWKLNIVDGEKFSQDPAALQKWIETLIHHPYDLSKDGMLRANLITFSEKDHLVILVLHHIASDGWSKAVMVKELVELYDQYTAGKKTTLLPLPVQYADYAIWQRTWLQGTVFDRKLGYWKKKLHGIAPLQLPADFTRPAVWTNRGAIMNFDIDGSLSASLLEFSHQQGVTLFMSLLTACKVLLYRHSGQQDICVGTPVAGRMQTELEGLIGFFVNTLALRTEVQGDLTFNELLQRVKETTMEAFAHQEIPFEKVVDAVVAKRDLSRNPIFQVMFVLRNTPEMPELRLGEVSLSPEDHKHRTSTFDIQFFITETSKKSLEGTVEYNTDLYKQETILLMISHFKELLLSVIKEPGQKIGLLPMLTKTEKHQLFIEFNNTKADYPNDKSIVSLFEEQVLKTPEAIAVIFEQQQLSYKLLNERSNQLAHYLRSRNVKTETLVPICLERSIDMIIGILGILKAGAAYIPVDPQYPEDRISFMINDSAAKIILCSKNSKSRLAVNGDIDIIELDTDQTILQTQPVENVQIHINPRHLAYVIYTSGSTGKPKGAMNEHRGVVNRLLWAQDYFMLTPEDAVLQKTTFSFDVSVWELMWPILVGSRLVFAKPEGHKDNHYLKYIIDKEKITLLHFVPSMLGVFLPDIQTGDCKSLLKVLCSGEALKAGQVALFKEKFPGVALYNLYGPTETAIDVTCWRFPGEDSPVHKVPIGKPVSNTVIYILQNDNTLSPTGCSGELYIGGIQVGRGYLNQPEQTAEKFIADPFTDKEGAMMYKTGDVGRWLPDGNIEYLGRVDQQVKLRGYRIELGEIETALNTLEQVADSCVVVKYQQGNADRLDVYYVPEPAIIKAKEIELYAQQVANWKAIYENEYISEHEKDESTDPEFNIIGWNDSFTNQPIPAGHMREWLNDIIAVILAGKPEQVLEIGCGTGLIYYPLADKLKKYTGTDFTQHSINQIQERINKGERTYCSTELQVIAAHEIAPGDHERIDTIIINSVIQYFPGAGYLGTVIEKSISLLNGNGRIIIGDVRDYRLLPAFKSRLLLQKLQGTVGIKEFNWAVEQDMLNEEELCFAPDYFYDLQLLYPQITHIEIHWKKADYINELSLYRYTVVLYVGIEKELIIPKWQNWNEGTVSGDVIHQLRAKHDIAALKDVPNPRLWKERLLQKSLSDSAVNTVDDIENALKIEDAASLQVKELFKIAAINGYHYKLLLDEDPLLINVVFERHPSLHFIKNIYSDNGAKTDVPKTNIPLFADISLLLQKEIKSLLLKQLPEYMVPSEWVALGKLPLTVNGKSDRRFLSEREDKILSNQLNYALPRNEVEEQLVAIWEELMHLERTGINDNFFELGGHSLMAMRVISSIRRQLNLEVAIKDLFLFPTIAELSVHLQSLRKGLVLPAIEKQVRQEYTPLSFSQERLWFIDRLSGSVPYQMPTVLRLKGRLDEKLLQDVLLAIIQRQEILRTVIIEKNGQGYQKLLDAEGWELKKTAGSVFENAEELTQYIQTIIDQPIDLSNDYMLRAHLIVLSELEHVLVITIHHIATDGWSAAVLVNEVVEFYHAFFENRPPKLPHLQLQYVDYAIWQRTRLQGELLERKLLYWKEKLAGVEPLELPADYLRPAVWSGRGSAVTFDINKKLTAALKAIAQQQGSTLFMTLLAAFNVLLHRYSGQNDICVGTPIGNRPQQELERLIGFFVNTLALRNEVTDDMPFVDLLQQVKNTTLEAYEHQEVPFEKVVDTVAKERDMSRNPIFQVLFSMQNTPEVLKLHFGELELIREVPEHTTSRFDLTFNLTEIKEAGLEMYIEYNTDLYNPGTITQIAVHYQTLLSAIVATPEEKIGLLPMITNQEKTRLLVEFNNTQSDYPKDKTITDLFVEQAVKTPEAIAVVYEKDQITYRDLNERSNQLAHYLRSKGIKKETLVPICLDRSLEMIIGILGILKAGGAYVPIDPQYPLERINYMLQDVGAGLVISSRDKGAKSAGIVNRIIIELDGDWETIAKQPVYNLPQETGNTDSLAYVFYTSGSTGRPKGVMVEHKGLTNRLVWAQNYYGLTDGDAVLQKTNYCFDVSVWELLWPLIAGARLVLARPDGNKDNEYLKYIINDQKITLLHFVPSMLSVFLADIQQGECSGLKRVLCSGEALTPAQAALFRKKLPHTELHNLYGPTEAAIDVTYWPLPKDEESKVILIGKPVSNTFIYILDNLNQCVPIQVTGEICIGGVQVARGYLNKDELTAEKFVTDIYSSNDGAKMYKTGDLGRWLPDGNIEYLGRKDEQVKIRGYRIELGEIECVLQQSGLVSQVVIVAKEDKNSNKRLIGYVVADSSFDKNTAIAYLKTRLPEYMVPAIWIELENLPLTSNGKTDRKALPDASMNDQSGNKYVAPRDQIEVDLAQVWKDLLHIDKIGIHNNFFELGGDSIIAIQVVSRMKDLGYSIHPRDIFIYQTISNLSSAVNSHTESFAEQDTLAGPVGLLPIQQWFFETEQTAISHFNQSILLAIDKKITAAVLTQAVEQIVHHHDALRFIYTHHNSQWQQEYGTALPAVVTEDIRPEQADALSTLIEQMTDSYQRSLDIERGDIMRVVWIQTPPEEKTNRLLIIIHHLAIDGVSWRIVLEDLEQLLTAFNNNDRVKTRPKTTSYRQWYQALENYGRSNQLLSQKTYWKKVANSFQPVIADRAYNGKVTAGETAEFTVKLQAAQTRRLLLEIPRVYHTEINDILLCALAKTLCEWGNRDEVVIGMEGHGRENISEGIDISRTVGWFTTLYPLLLQTGDAKGPDNLIKTVKEQLRQVPDKGLGYGVLKYINKEDMLQDRAAWDVQFNYLGQVDNVVRESKWLAVADEAPGTGRNEAWVVSDKLSINSHIREGELVMHWTYSTLHYHEETIRSLAADYLQQLEKLIDHCVQQGKAGVVYTPSDYGLGSDVSFRELDAFLEENNSENIMSF